MANVAEETINPQKTILKGFGSALSTLIILCVLVFLGAIGVGRWEAIVYASPGAPPSDSPLPLAMSAITGNSGWLYHLLITIGLMGLVASFHGIILAAGRATFEFGRVKYISPALGRVNGRFKTPANALLLNMVIGAVTLYIISMLSVLRLRKTERGMFRPFRVPFYPGFPLIALFIATVSMVAMISLNLKLAIIYFGILVLSYIWFQIFVKSKLDAS